LYDQKLSRPFSLTKSGTNAEVEISIGPKGDILTAPDIDTKGSAFYLSGVFAVYTDPGATKDLSLVFNADPNAGLTDVTVRTDELNGATNYALFPDTRLPVNGSATVTIPALGSGKAAQLTVVIGWL